MENRRFIRDNRRLDLHKTFRDREKRKNHESEVLEIRARNIRALLMQQTHSRYRIMQENLPMPLLRYPCRPNKPACQGG